LEPVAVDGDAEHTPTAALEADEVRAGLRSAIRSLPERERLVLGLYYDEGLTLAEIGGVIGLTESRVSQLHTRSVLSLRSRMRSAGLD
jgi:RNA polymerase sigma factor for flagellar operon FliA